MLKINTRYRNTRKKTISLTTEGHDQLKRYAEAKIEYQWIAARMPDNAIAHFLLAVSHDQLAEYLDAMANYQQFLRLADPAKNQLEIEKVNLRLPSLQKQIMEMKKK